MKKKLLLVVTALNIVISLLNYTETKVLADSNGQTDVSVIIKSQEKGIVPDQSGSEKPGTSGSSRLPQTNERATPYLMELGVISVLLAILLFLKNRRMANETK